MRSVLTPNHQARREELIRAAMTVLRRGGLGACTARAIADASPLTKSALHYYFADTDEIVDVAFRRLMEQFLERVQDAAAAAPDPLSALWAATETYLRLGSDRPDRVPMFWFEMQTMAVREHRAETVTELTVRAERFFTNLVAATGMPNAEALGSTWISALVGFVVRQAMLPRPPGELLEELSAAMAVPLPVAR
ncbi:MAG: TetR family transcriptional regulator [Acidimicrobiales bacterium]|nr:TetR family transcriptional regulator [Acidimicrobiales bacterium]